VLTIFEHLVTHHLLYTGDCKLLGITEAGLIYAEELYGAEDWLAQHRISIDDGILETVDEARGDNMEITLFDLPDDLIEPGLRMDCDPLEFSGARLQGIAEDERIDEVVRPLTMQDKMELVDFMEWEIAPPQIVGMAESAVLAHTRMSDDLMIVCRRVRVVYRLMNPTIDYDYDSLNVHLLHDYKPHNNDMPELVDCLNDIDDVVLLRPMDCLFHAGCLYVADGGEDDEVSAIHVFKLPAKSDM